MTPRRVAFVTTSYPAFPGDPAGHFVKTEALARATEGARVTVLAPIPESGSTPDDSTGVHVAWVPGGDGFGAPGVLERLRANPLRAGGIAAFVSRARRALEAHGPFDEVVAHWLVPSAWPISLVHRGPLEAVVHGSDVRVIERLPRPLAAFLVRRLLHRGVVFRFVSHELRNRLASATTPEVFRRSRVEPSALSVPVDLERAGSRKALGVRESERVAVVVGRLIASKRAHIAVRWAAERADRVVVIGDGPERSRIAASSAPEATFLGSLPHPEALRWIAAADLLVSASREEGSPTAIREARALGVPVVTAECGDLRDWAGKDPGITIVSE